MNAKTKLKKYRPRIGPLWKNYLNEGDLFDKVISETSPAGRMFARGSSTCGARMTYAFRDDPILRVPKRPAPGNEKIRRIGGGKNKNKTKNYYIFSTYEIEQYLKSKMGKHDLARWVNEENYKKIYKEIESKQGIILYRAAEPKRFEAYGHVDLFGTQSGYFTMCGNGREIEQYLKECTSEKDAKGAGRIMIWELPGRIPDEVW